MLQRIAFWNATGCSHQWEIDRRWPMPGVKRQKKIQPPA